MGSKGGVVEILRNYILWHQVEHKREHRQNRAMVRNGQDCGLTSAERLQVRRQNMLQ